MALSATVVSCLHWPSCSHASQSGPVRVLLHLQEQESGSRLPCRHFLLRRRRGVEEDGAVEAVEVVEVELR